MKRRYYDREAGEVIEEKSHLVCIMWEGSRLPESIRIYGGLFGLKVRPFIERMIQCYNCYKFGHFQKHCKAKKKCLICGDDFHGICDRDFKCSNCGKDHRPTDKNCDKFKYNEEIKKAIAMDNINVTEAKDKVNSDRGKKGKITYVPSRKGQKVNEDSRYEKSYAAVTKNNIPNKEGSNGSKEIGNVSEIVKRVSEVVEDRIKKYVKKELEDFRESMTKRLEEMEESLLKKIDDKIQECKKEINETIIEMIGRLTGQVEEEG